MSFAFIQRSLTGLLMGGLLLAGCSGSGGGGGGGGGGTTGSTDVLITDATIDDLLAFRATVQSLRMVSGTGIAGSNLLVAPVPIDLIGAGVSPRWVTREDLPEGTFRGVAVSFLIGSSTALDRAGAAVPVTEVNTNFELLFASPVTIDSSSYRQLLLDIDMAASLSGDTATPPISFDPVGTATLSSGGASSSVIDEVKGVVQSIDAGNNSFVIDAFADGDQTLPLGLVTVDVTGTTLLLDDNGVAFASVASFFSALVPSVTLLEVHGSLVGGNITATRVEVEDDGGGVSYVVKIDGRIANLDTVANTFDLQIIEIEKGSSIATPVIGGASSIAVSYTVATSIVLDEHTPTTEASLAEGQRVKVKFPAFVNAPFPASQIEIDDQPEFEGRITSVLGLPTTIVMRLDSDEPAIASGQVQNSSTDVVVDISGTTPFLDTHQEPTIATSLLQPGLKIEVHGAISGPPGGPTIVSTRTKIHSGRFEGDVTAILPGVSTFDAAMTDLKDSFGNSVVLGNVTVILDPLCIFDGDATDENGFFALFTGLSGGETPEVEVFGVGTVTTPNEILCYEIKARVN